MLPFGSGVKKERAFIHLIYPLRDGSAPWLVLQPEPKQQHHWNNHIHQQAGHQAQGAVLA